MLVSIDWQNRGQGSAILRDESVSRPLSEQAQHGGDQESTAHTRGLEEVKPGFLGRLELKADGCLHLSKLGGNKLQAAITFSMVLGEDVLGFLGAVFGDQPAGALGEEASS